jgi:1-acyl-sn-glycerol-3-phosphate acyltransferase
LNDRRSFRPPFDPDRLDAREPELVARLLPWFTALCDRYFRLHVEGLEHVGDEPLILAGNHNNGIVGPEVAATFVTLLNRRGPEAPIYALAHDFAMCQLRPLGALLQRCGGVRATPDNARRILAIGGQVIVYPGGDLEAYRPTRRRDEIILGERTGFVRIAQQTGVPIVPVVVHGAHRSAYIFSDGEAIARLLRLKRLARIERFPLALALPWGFTASPWVPYLPLPFKLRLRFLPPVRVAPHDDAACVREHLRALMQAALDEMAEAARLRNA